MESPLRANSKLAGAVGKLLASIHVQVELDHQGHILFAPSREEMLARLSRTPVPTT